MTARHGALPYSSIASYMQELPIRMVFVMRSRLCSVWKSWVGFGRDHYGPGIFLPWAFWRA